VTRVTSFVSLLMPLMMISRARGHMSNGEFDPAKEFEMNTALDTALEKVQDIERSLIVTGAGLPLGGSLLLVAHKP